MTSEQAAKLWELAGKEEDFPLFCMLVQQDGELGAIDNIDLMSLHALYYQPMLEIMHRMGGVKQFSARTTIPFNTAKGWGVRPIQPHLKFLACAFLNMINIDD